MSRIDGVAWVVVLVFFIASALMYGGNVQHAFLAALAIIVLLFIVSHSIELILRALSDHPKLGEITGYVTNGPEALVLIVGLIHHKLDMAMGVPLGSNFANPILMVMAALLTGSVVVMLKQNTWRTLPILIVAMALAGGYFLIPKTLMALSGWAAVTLIASVLMYLYKGTESNEEAGLDGGDDDNLATSISFWYLVPAVVLLVGAGYFLDSVVTQAAQVSHVPEGMISFFVLSFMTSWPEFRAALALFQRHQPASGVMNIVVSNITNLWLAVAGVGAYVLFQRP